MINQSELSAEWLNKISKQHGLIFNFQEEVPPRNNSLQKSATNFTWFLKRSNVVKTEELGHP